MAARLTAYLVALIVGVTFIAGLIVGAQRSDDGPVDVMVINGRVYTADAEGTTAEAVAIQGNKIVRVGSTREIQRLRRAQTVVIDAQGGSVLPGFTKTDAQWLEPHAEAGVGRVLGPPSSLTRDDELSLLRRAMSEANRRGITTVHTAAATPREFDLYDELRREGALSVRVYGALAMPATSSEVELDRFDALRRRFPDDPFLKAGAAEVSFNADDVSSEALERLVGGLDRRNWQVTLKARDDGALAMALRAFKHAISTNPAPAKGRRHRVEAVDLVGPVDFAPFDELGIVHPPHPEPLSIGDALDARTRTAAWMSYDEHRKGTLARDMLADVVILSKDILSQPDGRLDEVEVNATIFDGKVVFQKLTASGY